MTTSSPARRARVRAIRRSRQSAVEAAATSARAVLDRELASLRELQASHAPLSEVTSQHARLRAAVTIAYDSAAAAAASLAGDYQAWSRWRAEVARLSSLRQNVMMRERDDLGVLPAAVVRIGSRASVRPLQAGMVAEAPSYVRAVLATPRIGVDLSATLAEARANESARAARAELDGEAGPTHPRVDPLIAAAS